MSVVDVQSSEDFLLQLGAYIRKQVADSDGLISFINRLHVHTQPEDVNGRAFADLCASLRSDYALFLQGATDHDGPRIQVFNPSMETDGWSSPRSIVQIYWHRDMPFVTDSSLMMVHRNDLTLHYMHNVVLPVCRDAKGNFLGFDEDTGTAELIIHAEVDPLDQEGCNNLKQDLTETLCDVDVVVEDFTAMRARVQSLIDEMDTYRQWFDESEVQEAREFLSWLLEDKFTFLGYREFAIHGEGAEQSVEQVAGSELGILKRQKPARSRLLMDMPQPTRDLIVDRRSILQFSQRGTRSTVHRPAYPDYVAVRRFDAAGHVTGECNLLGLYVSSVYQQSPWTIPVVRRRVGEVMQRSGFKPDSYDGKVMKQLLITFPREELFQSNLDMLYQTIVRITQNHERFRLQVFIRPGQYGMFFFCLVYTPRELYTTLLRESIQAVLTEELGALGSDFTTYFSESVLIRIHFVLRVDPSRLVRWDHEKIERRIRDIALRWEDKLQGLLEERFGEERARTLLRRYGHMFPVAYRDRFDHQEAVYDIGHLERLNGSEGSLVMRLHRKPEDPLTRIRLKVYCQGASLALSDLMPMLENLGGRVLEQRPFALHRKSHQDPQLTIYDFAIEHAQDLNLNVVGPLFEETFMNTWSGDTHNDSFNKLVLAAGLSWREVSMLRAYAHYMKQTDFPIGEQFISDTLLRHIRVTPILVQYFHLLHDPQQGLKIGPDSDILRQDILDELDRIPSLNEDRVLRHYLALIDATLRTNFYQQKNYLALKLSGAQIPDLPKPVMAFEIFVCGADVEGVHLRFGPIARGGIRWSERLEDYRTEILGLVKAQQVKNSMIVPQGAKGGFVITRSLQGMTRDERQAAGVQAYRRFICALLDLTDNRVDGKLVMPPDVRCHDDADPYLVVAADKGTATFSDIANEVSGEYGFWLGDAFASGGSEGYDHKKMGITARGAWISVRQHFLELGTDVQQDPVTVLGIGDMAGDVFGNGMLCSSALRLVAAFNHQHIFLDPNPDVQVSYTERQRLFNLPRSSWEDYDTQLISEGGGVFSRQAKTIPVSHQVQERFGISDDHLAPDELLHKLLTTQVDLIWNGGIGTYVKASSESHAEVGDKANDSLRVDGCDLRCRVIGEGGNLGLTQQGRVEAALSGVALNTDFIDNSGGVNCSDHEVNLKVLLAEVMADGELTLSRRNSLLREMTDEVSELVLADNLRQAQALSLTYDHARDRTSEYQRLMAYMEANMGLDRELEDLPTDEAIADRLRAGKHLTRPELAVLLAYAKSEIKRDLIGTRISEQTRANEFACSEFPEPFNERFADRLPRHYVYEHIVATRIANDLVNHLGASVVGQIRQHTGAGLEEVVHAWLIVREIFGIPGLFRKIEELPVAVSMSLRMEMMQELLRLGRRGCRWFLRYQRQQLASSDRIDFFHPAMQRLQALWRQQELDEAGAGSLLHRLMQAGVPEDLASTVAASNNHSSSPSIVLASRHASQAPDITYQAYVQLASLLQLDRLRMAISSFAPESSWQAMEREVLLDELITHLCHLCEEACAEADVNMWLRDRPEFVQKWQKTVADAFHGEKVELAMYTITVRKLGDLLRVL